MSRELVILCDADDVIERLVDLWVERLNVDLGTSVSPGDITEWDIGKFFPSATKGDLYKPFDEDGFWDGLQPMPLAYDYLQRILFDGHRVFITTNTHYRSCRPKLDRILSLFPFLRWEDFIITANKQIIRGDVLIDDAVHNLIGGPYKKILFTRPHNSSFNTSGTEITRANNWREVYEIINNLEG